MSKRSAAEIRPATPVADTSGASGELSSLLLSVLRNADRQTRSVLEPGSPAKAAVEQYDDIAEDLRVLPENGIDPGTGFGTSSRA